MDVLDGRVGVQLDATLDDNVEEAGNEFVGPEGENLC